MPMRALNHPIRSVRTGPGLGRRQVVRTGLFGAIGMLLGTLVPYALGPSTAAATTPNSATTTTAPSPTATTLIPAYWLVASDGGVFAFGGLPNHGSMGGQPLNKPVVGMAATHDQGGYWLDASDGGIFSFGDAQFYGSTGSLVLNEPAVGMAATPDGKGYWLVASDGGIFAFGDAQFYGSTGSLVLNKPVVGMAPTADGKGYWLVASDGGIFAFGDAQFHGSTGSLVLNQPVVSMAATSDGAGYWMVASDGGVFAFGDAKFYGSTGGEALTRSVVAMGTTPNSDGYWFSDVAGMVFNFGSAGYFGSAPPHLNAPVVGMTIGLASGSSAGDPTYPSGSYGYDISGWQCTSPLPPAPHQIGIVEVAGQSYGAANPCLAAEAAWAGGGLNLYLFLTYGDQSTGPAICNGSTACNAGYGAAQYAFGQAGSAGVNTSVTWWLDVENPPPGYAPWSTDTSANAAYVNGAVQGLKAEGVNNVGIYTSELTWNGIVGSYQPQLPLWVAWYSGNPPQQNCATAYSYAASHGATLPSGGVWITQYTDTANGVSLDGDYAC
jgi:hypothetical protein